MTATMLEQQPDAASANPLGLNGFEFVEFTSPEPDRMAAQFEAPVSYTHLTLPTIYSV